MSRARTTIVSGLLVTLLFAIVSMATPTDSARADARERVDNLTVRLSLQQDGSLRVSETIEYNFGDSQRRGIFRDIPLEGDESTIENVQVTRNGKREATAFENTGQWLRIRIGNPDVYISGTHTYKLTYVSRQALTEVADSPGMLALSWDAVGDGWSVPIARSEVSVATKHPFRSIQCVTGERGSRTPCLKSGPRTFRTSSLRAGEGITIVAPLKPGHGLTDAVGGDPLRDTPLLDAPGNPTIDTPSATAVAPANGGTFSGAGLWASMAAFAVGIAAACGSAFLLRRREARAPVQYEPPRELTPLQLGAVLNPGALPQSATVAGALLDLAQRGWVGVSLSDDSEPKIVARGGGTEPLSPAETVLLNALLQGRAGEVELTSALLADQSSQLQEVQRLASDSVPLDRHPHPHRLRNLWTLGALVLMTAGGAGLLLTLLVPACAALGAGLGMLVLRAAVRRGRSADEELLSAQAAGFRRLLSTDAAELRIAYAEKTGYEPAALAATLLPYAVVLGVDAEWLAAFPDVTLDQVGAAGGVAGLALVGPRGIRQLKRATRESLSPTHVDSSTASDVFTGVLRGPGFSSGRGFSGTRGFSRRSGGIRRTGGGRGGGGGGSW